MGRMGHGVHAQVKGLAEHTSVAQQKNGALQSTQLDCRAIKEVHNKSYKYRSLGIIHIFQTPNCETDTL